MRTNTVRVDGGYTGLLLTCLRNKPKILINYTRGPDAMKQTPKSKKKNRTSLLYKTMVCRVCN